MGVFLIALSQNFSIQGCKKLTFLDFFRFSDYIFLVKADKY